MTRWTITLDDSSTQVSLDMLAGEGATYQRSIVRWKTSAGYTSNNNPLIDGPAGDYRLSWNIAAYCSEEDGLMLLGMFRDQNLAYDNGGASVLELTDEFEYLIPEAGPTLSKPILAGSQITLPNARITGFPQVPVKIDLPQEPWGHGGALSDGELLKIIRFTAWEVD